MKSQSVAGSTACYTIGAVIHVLGVIGLTNVEVIRVEGHAYGPEAAEKAMSEALSKVAKVAIAA